ncbi:MAG: hypothetical protein J1E85_05250 [Ruminococcus sp.]|nr:hypothetical protein [Ruminococcus sp.]
MSKKSKTKKKNSNKTANAKKSVNKLRIAILIVAVLVVVGIIASIVIVNANSDTAKIKNELCKAKWTPLSATDASGDEVDMAQVYNTDYSSYEGSLEYSDDNTFSFWLSPGSPDDGTHTGTYEVADDKTVNMYFDDGTNTRFSINCEDNKVLSIEVNYDGYLIIFTSEQI